MGSSTSRSVHRRLAAAVCLFVSGMCGFVSAPANANSAKLCAMLSPGELHSWFGKAYHVRPSDDYPERQTCAWAPVDGSLGTLLVLTAPADYYSTASSVDGPKKLQGIGEKAYVGKLFGGWTAGALKGTKIVKLNLPAGIGTEKTAVAVLKTLVSRM